MPHAKHRQQCCDRIVGSLQTAFETIDALVSKIELLKITDGAEWLFRET
jgi:hypothetical protein